MRLIRLGLLGTLGLAALSLTAALGGCGSDAPVEDHCTIPSSAGVSTIDFVALSGTGSALTDLQTQGLITGPQGGSMVELRFDLRGDAVPLCASFILSAEKCLNLECTELEVAEVFPAAPALQTYANDGGRDTKTYQMEIPFRFMAGTLLRVTAEVGMARGSVLMWIEQEGVLRDAGLEDANQNDAGPIDASGV